MKKHFSPALIVASIALLVALGGTSFAAVAIDGHSIKNHSVPAVKLTSSAVASLHGLRGPRGYTGSQGQQGFQGPSGAAGANGANGLNGGFDPNKLTLVDGGSYSVAPNDDVTANVYCPADHPTPIFAGVGSYTGQITSLIIFPALRLSTIRVSNYAETTTITFNPYVVCSAS
jgi:hypothetical protein